MKRALLSAALLLAAFSMPIPAAALQKYYLATSPDGQTRVVVSQRLLRRVEDRMFFEYPVSLVDAKTGASFELFTSGGPLVKETDRGTFTYDPDALKVEWAPEGSKLVVFWEREEGVWSVTLVDRDAKTQMDLLPELKKGLARKALAGGMECETPSVTLTKWLSPEKPVFRLDSECGKHLKENRDMHKMTAFTHWVMYDGVKKVIKDCVGCEEEKAMKIFTKKPKPTPTPTPVADETPTN